MGWTTGYTSRKEVVETVTEAWENDMRRTECIRKFFSGNNLWCVFEQRSKAASTDVERFIAVFLIRCWKLQGGEMDWGYKDVSESMGPCEVSCPLSFLDMVPDPGGYATAWRERVRAAHACKNQKLAVGQTITLTNNHQYRVTKLLGRRVYGVEVATGNEYRIPRGMLLQAVSVS